MSNRDYAHKTVAVELMDRPEGHEGIWTPSMPVHADGSQHHNVGMDFFSATRVVATERGIVPNLPVGIFRLNIDRRVDIEQLEMLQQRLKSTMEEELPYTMVALPEGAKLDYMTGSDNALHYYEAVIPTGVRIALPPRMHMRMASRSGLGFKKNILAFPGTIDNSYRGQIMIKLSQLTPNPEPFVIEAGDKVAQGIVFRSEEYIIEEGTVDLNTPRGENGFGSTS